jgi:hypothetical protein
LIVPTGHGFNVTICARNIIARSGIGRALFESLVKQAGDANFSNGWRWIYR